MEGQTPEGQMMEGQTSEGHVADIRLANRLSHLTSTGSDHIVGLLIKGVKSRNINSEITAFKVAHW